MTINKTNSRLPILMMGATFSRSDGFWQIHVPSAVAEQIVELLPAARILMHTTRRGSMAEVGVNHLALQGLAAGNPDIIYAEFYAALSRATASLPISSAPDPAP